MCTRTYTWTQCYIYGNACEYDDPSCMCILCKHNVSSPSFSTYSMHGSFFKLNVPGVLSRNQHQLFTSVCQSSQPWAAVAMVMQIILSAACVSPVSGGDFAMGIRGGHVCSSLSETHYACDVCPLYTCTSRTARAYTHELQHHTHTYCMRHESTIHIHIMHTQDSMHACITHKTII